MFDIFAVYPDATYKIAVSTDKEHGLDFAERVCKKLGKWPHVFFAAPQYGFPIKGKILSLEDFKNRS